MNILITHAYTKENKGDAAILSVLLSQLSSVYPSARIKISILDDVSKNKTFEGHKNISSYLYLITYGYKNILIKAIYSSYIILSTLLWTIFYRLFKIKISFILDERVKKITLEIYDSELIVPIGGGYIRSKPTLGDSLNLFLVLHPIFIARILSKPIVLYSQSIGPFYNKFQKGIVRLALKKVSLIMAREDYTVKTLRKLGIKKNVVRTVDAAFLFHSNGKRITDFIDKSEIKDKVVIGITVRQWLPENKQKKYESEIANFISYLASDKKYLFIFIPQVSSNLHGDDDRIVAKRILNLISNKTNVINLTNVKSHYDIKSIYGGLNYLIGTRFHSVIFSLTSGVPSIAIGYEYKTDGIMKDLGLQSWVLSIENVTKNLLLEKFKNLQASEKVYRQKLSRNLPSYISKAEKNIVHLSKIAI